MATTFTVSAEIIDLLGNGYKRSEYAIRELVDNAWDADADTVWLTVPDAMPPDGTAYCLTVQDDGNGMRPDEIRRYYLNIANNRHLMRGDFTQKGRTVKGRKGIGKFAGLYVGAAMAVESCAGGQCSRVEFTKESIKQAVAEGKDLQALPLPFHQEDCAATDHGTTITIRHLHQWLELPNPAHIRQVLALEYCRSEGFAIYINGELLDVTDVAGQVSIREEVVPDVGPVRLRFVIAHSRQLQRTAGISLRVRSKVVGKPGFYGVRDRLPDLPRKFFGYVFGEIEADDLLDLISADSTGLPEDTRAHRALKDFVGNHLEVALRAAFQSQLAVAQARLAKQVRLAVLKLPEHKREFARQEIERAIRKHFFDVPKEKLWAIVSVILEAIERDEYWEVLKRLDAASHGEVGILAEALNQFGLIDLTRTARTADVRRQFLTHLQGLAGKPATTEQEMHEAIERNLWLLGPDKVLLFSNQALKTIVGKLPNQTKAYTGKKGAHRPDLLLAKNYAGVYLLIELKRPSYTITNLEVAQAANYRQELIPHVEHGARIDILVVGGKLNLAAQYQPGETTSARATTFDALISDAAAMLDWLMQELVKAA